MSKNKVPEIKIEKESYSNAGIGLMKISDLKDATPQNNHNPYRAHRLKFNLIILVLEGSEGIHNVDFKNYAYQKNAVFFIAKDQVHHFIDLPKNNDGELLVFNENVFHSLSKSFPELVNHFYNCSIYEPVITLSKNAMQDINMLTQQIRTEKEQPSSSIQNEILLTYLKIILLKILKERSNTLKVKDIDSLSLSIFLQFQQLVRQYYTKEKSITFYANALHISSHKLNIATNQVLQFTAKQYIVETIILEAKRYLKATDLSVKEISYVLGFDEPTNFNKFFKRYTKFSPLEFVKKSY